MGWRVLHALWYKQCVHIFLVGLAKQLLGANTTVDYIMAAISPVILPEVMLQQHTYQLECSSSHIQVQDTLIDACVLAVTHQLYLHPVKHTRYITAASKQAAQSGE
jgi:hypothetical protein